MLVELRVGEQRLRACGRCWTAPGWLEVARRFTESRQSVHTWLRRMPPIRHSVIVVPAVWLSASDEPGDRGPDCGGQAGASGVGCGPDRLPAGQGPDRVPVPGRTSIYRAPTRNGLVVPGRRRRRRADYRRWERARPMELWQMDVVGGFHLADGTELKAVSGIDDSSRFAISAQLVRRATAGPVCEALLAALRRHGIPDQILTDNGKVFTGRFGPAGSSAEVLFDRICAENGIRHLLTAPRSPTTTGKVERWHKTIRAEFLRDHDHRHATVAELQAALDAWVNHYNTERPHQSLGCGHRSIGSSSPPLRSGDRRRARAGSAVNRAASGGADHPDRAAARGAAVGGPAWADLLCRVPLSGADRAGRGAGRGRRRRASGADLPP